MGLRTPEWVCKESHLTRPGHLELGKLHVATFAWCHGHLSHGAKRNVLANMGCVWSARLPILTGIHGENVAVCPPTSGSPGGSGSGFQQWLNCTRTLTSDSRRAPKTSVATTSACPGSRHQGFVAGVEGDASSPDSTLCTDTALLLSARVVLTTPFPPREKLNI